LVTLTGKGECHLSNQLDPQQPGLEEKGEMFLVEQIARSHGRGPGRTIKSTWDSRGSGYKYIGRYNPFYYRFLNSGQAAVLFLF
jgi:hypothetical protein